MNLRTYCNERSRNRRGRVYVFHGGDEVTREFLLFEALYKHSYHPMDKDVVSTWQEAYEKAVKQPVDGECRVVIVRECEDPMAFYPLQKPLEQLATTIVFITSPVPKVKTDVEWPEFVKRLGFWVRLKPAYSADEFNRILLARYNKWGPDVRRAVIEHSTTSAASVLVNARSLALYPSPTAKAAQLMFTGGQGDAFAFANAFMRHDLDKVVRLTVNPQIAMGVLFYRVCQIYRLMSEREHGADEWRALDRMNVPAFMRKDIREVSQMWTAEELLTLLEKLTELSLRMRQSQNGVLELLMSMAK